MNPLLDAVRRYADAHADTDGVAQTPIPGLMIVRATEPSGLVYAILEAASLCLVMGKAASCRRSALRNSGCLPPAISLLAIRN